MSHVTGFNHVSVLVSDTGRALAFYQDLLGLPVVPRPGPGPAGAWLDLGRGQQLHLLELASQKRADTSRHGGGDYHFALYVDDLDAVMEVLTFAGVACIPSRSGRRALFCRDPDGNAVELVERSAR